MRGTYFILKSKVILFLFFSLYLLGQVQDNSLLFDSNNYYSSHGEDGILEEIFHRLGVVKGKFLQIGNKIGFEDSFIHRLYDKGWSGFIVEYEKDYYVDLEIEFSQNQSIEILHHDVTYNLMCKKGFSVEELANMYFPGNSIDFLYIKTYGTEHKILEMLKRKPKVICIYGGIFWNPLNSTKVVDPIALRNLQQPLMVMIDIAKKKGYRPVCFTDHLILVRQGYMRLFHEIQNDAYSLWRDSWEEVLSEVEKHAILEKRRTDSYIQFVEPEEFYDLPL